MLQVLTRIVGRQVEKLNTLTKGGAVELDVCNDELLDAAIDRVVKLAREERMGEGVDVSKLSNEQLLAMQKKQPDGDSSDRK